MVRRHPDRSAVMSKLDELKAQSCGSGARVSVLALARSVGMSNTTFRRVFPDLVADVTAFERPPKPPLKSQENQAEKLAKVRRRNRDLEENIIVAVDAIQRLTLENRRLRAELEAVRSVVPIRSRRSAKPKGGSVSPGV
jgi:hypothetical protein